MRDLETHLYTEDGRFLFAGKRLGVCAACTDKDWTYNVGALGPNTRFCRRCIEHTTPQQLRKEANEALQRASEKVNALRNAWGEMQERYQKRFGAPLQLHRKA